MAKRGTKAPAKLWTPPKMWPVQDPKQYWPLARFKPYEHNPRTHPPAQIELLGALLAKWGPDQPIVVDEDEVILKGHGRRLGAAAGGLEYFTVIQRFDLSEDDKRAMRIADNQVALLAGWDRALVYNEVTSLKASGYQVALLGFGDAQLVQFLTTPAPPQQFPAFGENIPTQYECPHCHYKWSGKPTPSSDGDAPAPRKTKSTKKKAK